MRLQHKTFEIFADYHQFYLWDRGMNPQAPEEYNKVDIENRIKVGSHVVVIQPERNDAVNVDLEIHDSEPPLDVSGWDHVAEASLHVPTGSLQVHECTGGVVADFAIEPGWYRVRSFHGGFDSVEEAGDQYRIMMWPAPYGDVTVLKQYCKV